MRTTACLYNLAAVLVLAVSLAGSWAGTGVSARQFDTERMALERRYTTPHSLGDNYVFDPRDGWETVNVTNMIRRYAARADPDDHEEEVEHSNLPGSHGTGSSSGKHTLVSRAKKKDTKKTTTANKSSNKSSNKSPKKTVSSNTATNILKGGLSKVMDSFKGVGNPESVLITWYTGHDLLNPSCWENPTWAPSDDSFAAALTLDGWNTKPKCFKFLELCNTPKKCTFVRVVDSCAGCAKGSKHVDLTKAAFTHLADLDKGILSVQMRPATDPIEWFMDLWGPEEQANK